MKFLSLDTSTCNSVVSVSNQEGVIFGERRLFEKGRCDGLLSLVGHCLKKAKTKIEEVDFFAAGIGPGSFTGLRIGISVVKALNYALSKSCLAFSSLDAIAYNEMLFQRQQLCVCVDAKRSNVYCRFYAFDKNKKLRPVSGDLLLAQDVFLKRVNSDMALAGDALCLWKQKLPPELKRAQLMDEEFWYPTPQSLFRLTLESYKDGRPLDCFALNAKYLYEKDCQVHRSAKVLKKG